MARTKKTEEPKAETTTAEETPKAGEDKGGKENTLEMRLSALETIVENYAKRIAELERVTAYRKPVTSADILGL